MTTLSGRWFVIARLTGLSLLVSLLSGCFWFTSRARGDALEERTEELTTRVDDLEKQLEQDREQYTSLIKQAEADVAELEDVLKRATRAAADYAADTGNFREDLARLEGSIAELRQDLSKTRTTMTQRENDIRDRMETIAAKVGLDPPLDPATIPQEPEKLLAAADQEREGGNLGKARSLYRAYIERYPTNELADNAQLKIGRTYAKQERHPQALTTLNVIVDRYPESDVMGETLLAMANSLYKMRSCNDAITLLQAVLARYRDDSLVREARGKLREVQRAKRRGCRP